MQKEVTVVFVGGNAEKDNRNAYGHCYAGKGCRDAGAQQSQLRTTTNAVNEHIVARNVEDVATYHDKHGGLGMADGIEKLLESVEPTHKRQ